MKFRGMNYNRVGMKKVVVRRSIDLKELGDLGLITDTSSDLPTAGALHRGGLAATSGTRHYTDLGKIYNDPRVDIQDMGYLVEEILDPVISDYDGGWYNSTPSGNELDGGYYNSTNTDTANGGTA